jgi:putative NADH-flavin reductase
MKVILFGASGMVGQGVLRECLLDARVERVLSIVRTKTGQQHDKLSEGVHANFLDFTAIESELSGFDACFFSLGFPRYVTTTEQVGRAMIKVAERGAPNRILENIDIHRV